MQKEPGRKATVTGNIHLLERSPGSFIFWGALSFCLQHTTTRTGWCNQFHPTPINSVKQPVGREEKPEINSSCFIGLTGYFRLFRSICWLVCSVAAVPAKCHRGTSGQGRPYQKVNARLTVGSGCFFGWADLAVICSHEHHHGQIAMGKITITATFAEHLL